MIGAFNAAGRGLGRASTATQAKKAKGKANEGDQDQDKKKLSGKHANKHLASNSAGDHGKKLKGNKGKANEKTEAKTRGPGAQKAGRVPPGLRDKLGKLPSNNPWASSGKSSGGETSSGGAVAASPANTSNAKAKASAKQTPSANPLASASLIRSANNPQATQQTAAPSLQQQVARQALQQTGSLLKPSVNGSSPGKIIDQNVLNSMKAGDTAGFIRSLSGNVQNSLNYATGLFFQITA